MSVASIGYVRIESKDQSAWVDFGTAVLGLMENPRPDAAGARFLRMDAHPFRFMIEAGERDCLAASGLEFRNKAEWQACCDRLVEAGHTLEGGSESEAQRRCVVQFVTTADPSGNVLELYYGRKLDYVPLNSPAGIKAFVTGDEYTGDMGFGHAVLPAPDTEATHRYYIDLIGLGDSDDLTPPMPEGAPETRIIFMHADNPRQHSLALYNHPHPAGVVHLMVEVESLDEVGMAMERAKAGNHPIIASLGRHANDNMCSFYVLAPGGIAVEFGYDGLLVDWDSYTPTVSIEGDLWGHEYNFPDPE
jgi:3,4-dihydroxy-9,10-secoandrosta-1,3,5(10)-triene-9,17-dione 4,5-dioxygenase